MNSKSNFSFFKTFNACLTTLQLSALSFDNFFGLLIQKSTFKFFAFFKIFSESELTKVLLINLDFCDALMVQYIKGLLLNVFKFLFCILLLPYLAGIIAKIFFFFKKILKFFFFIY